MQASAVFSSEGINTITQKVQGLVNKYNYDIAIHLTQFPIDLKRKESLSQEKLDELEETTRELAYKHYGKSKIGPKPNNKGILIDLDFRIHHEIETEKASG